VLKTVTMEDDGARQESDARAACGLSHRSPHIRSSRNTGQAEHRGGALRIRASLWPFSTFGTVIVLWSFPLQLRQHEMIATMFPSEPGGYESNAPRGFCVAVTWTYSMGRSEGLRSAQSAGVRGSHQGRGLVVRLTTSDDGSPTITPQP